MRDISRAENDPQKAQEPSDAVVWGPHYTGEDIANVEAVNRWLKERNFQKASLARLARVSTSGLSQILSGYYAASPSKQIVSLLSAMKHADEQATQKSTSAVVETSVFRLVNMACNMARRYRNFSVVTGYVGTGKTFALKYYAEHRPNTYLVEATPAMTHQSMARHLAIMVGFEGKGSIADKFEHIVGTLKNTDSLLIIDEAETLKPSQLHLIRRIRDVANIGIVLSGTEHLSGLIRPAHGQFDQIRSRVGFWPETVRAITLEDAAALVQSAFGEEEVPEDVISRLFAYSRGSARMLSEGLVAALKEFREGRTLDTKLVDAVAKQALCLQSLA